jgi:endonuclease YncB( thermonuclease family)
LPDLHFLLYWSTRQSGVIAVITYPDSMKTPRKSRHRPRPARLSALLLMPVLLLGISIAQLREEGELTWHRDVLQDLREYLYTFSNPGQPVLPADSPNATYDMAGKAIAVADGDTFTLRLSGQRDFRIRLFGIDTPERDQAFGRIAGRALADRILGKDVYIELRDIDQYGRLVSVVHTEAGNINESLVRDGLAWWYRDFAADETTLEAAELAARTAGTGLWQDSNPVPPWEWRRRQ